MNEKIIRGIMVGRFQPFHKGHLSLVKQIFEDCEELIIAIGSAQFNYITQDPFTAGERILMIHQALSEARIDLTKCYLVPIINDENNARWFAHLTSMVPHFDVLFSGNQFVRSLVAENVKIKKPQFISKRYYNGTYIRKTIAAESDNWQKLVPNGVAKIIEEIGGVTRIKMLSYSDSNPQRW
jgi:nicotinamide-nucleotide adenylyltransferase